MNLDGIDDFLTMVEDGYVLVYGKTGGFVEDNTLASVEGATKITLPAGITRGGPAVMFNAGGKTSMVIQVPPLGADGWRSVVVWPQSGGSGSTQEVGQMGLSAVSNEKPDMSGVVNVMELFVGRVRGLCLVRGAPNANSGQGAVYAVPFSALPQQDSAASGVLSILTWVI